MSGKLKVFIVTFPKLSKTVFSRFRNFKNFDTFNSLKIVLYSLKNCTSVFIMEPVKCIYFGQFS